MTSILPPITINLYKPPVTYIHQPYELPIATTTGSVSPGSFNHFDNAPKDFQNVSHVSSKPLSLKPAWCGNENSSPHLLRNKKRVQHVCLVAHNGRDVDTSDVGRNRATDREFSPIDKHVFQRDDFLSDSETSQGRKSVEIWARAGTELQNTANSAAFDTSSSACDTQPPIRNSAVVKLDANVVLEPFPTLCSDGPATPQAKKHAIVTTTSSRPPQTGRIKGQFHHPRLSNASSAFVHSVKTASISNASQSLWPKSSRLARSSDSASHAFPPSNSAGIHDIISLSALDEAAFVRGVKRRQIIDELISTEESYVSDLRALVYLYSTLLATASTITNSLRLSIQRNVMSLLRLHEDLVEKLHKAAYRAAARKWIDTASPGHLAGGLDKQHYCGDLKSDPRNCMRKNHYGVLGTNQKNVEKLPGRLIVADTADILDLAAILEEHLTSFLLYEEYSANHEVITHELQAQTPVLWSTYEAGIESLATILSTIDEKSNYTRKGLTVGDLLIKPIQRICKYPLLLDDLLKYLPLADGSGAHEVLNGILQCLKETVWAVNVATDNHFARLQIQRRVLVQNCLNLRAAGIPQERFRELGHVQLCGVLFVAYQTKQVVDGYYALCVLFDNHFLIAAPGGQEGFFEPVALINLTDLYVGSVEDGKAQSVVYELLLSACSSREQSEWLSGLEGYLKPCSQEELLASSFQTKCHVDLKPIGKTYAHSAPLSRQLSIQRAVTSANRPASCQIILRNTHNPQDLQDLRSVSAPQVNRSYSHASPNKVFILAPKRTERTKLEALLGDVWTKDKLPYPGMITSKGSQILRASAGSLVRKLSLASIQAPFSRRSASIAASSKKSCEALSSGKRDNTSFRVRRKSFGDRTPIRNTRPKDIPELDTMDNVIGRMIGGGSLGSKRLSFSGGEKSVLKRSQVRRRASSYQVGPEDPAAIFYDNDDKCEEIAQKLAQGAVKNDVAEREAKRPRWSNPIAKLKELKAEGLRIMLLPSK